MEIYKIVLTGGPCSGKTSVTESIKEKLTQAGYYVIAVSETASELIRSNILPNEDYNHTLKFQETVLSLQMVKERNAESYANYADINKTVIILYDRGIMDTYAYFHKKEDFDNMLDKYSLNEIGIVDGYDLIINLISLASLKKELYENDLIRKEDVLSASILDKKTSEAWMLSENVRIIKPKDILEEKMECVYEMIIEFIKEKSLNAPEITKIDISNSDFTIYTPENSKKIEVNEYISLEHKIYERIYKGSKSYLLKNISKHENDNESCTKIDNKAFAEILKKETIYEINSYFSISFIDSNFDLFRIEYNDKYGIIKKYDDNAVIPSNIKIKK